MRALETNTPIRNRAGDAPSGGPGLNHFLKDQVADPPDPETCLLSPVGFNEQLGHARTP
jgi:hypothetical protein